MRHILGLAIITNEYSESNKSYENGVFHEPTMIGERCMELILGRRSFSRKGKLLGLRRLDRRNRADNLKASAQAPSGRLYRDPTISVLDALWYVA